MAEQNTNSKGTQNQNVDSTQAQLDPKAELQKSLEQNINDLDDILKARSDDYEEKMKDPKWRAKMKNMIEKAEKMTDEGEDEGEDDEDEKEEKGKGKMKKSLDDVVSENEEIIDAVPVLKSFVKVLEGLTNTVEQLQKSLEENNDFQKSLAKVALDESKLIKSISDEVEKIAKQPLPVKGKISKEQILNKSFGEETGSMVPSRGDLESVKSILLKSVQDGELSSMEISKWEMYNYNMQALSPKALSVIERGIGGKR